MALRQGDALVVVDVQNDFLSGGRLAVGDGDAVVPVLNDCIERFVSLGLPVIATRDWHPAQHCSFEARGGPWPAHCLAGTAGAEFAADLQLPDTVVVVSKGTDVAREAYSGFDGTDLARRLHALQAARLVVGGLATDYCVLATVRDALREGFAVTVLVDGIRAVEARPGDSERALNAMANAGARIVDSDALLADG